MIRKDREITEYADIVKIVQRCHVCRLAFNDRQEGYPYVVPMNFGVAYNNEKLILAFHCAKRGKKLDLLQADNHVAFEMECDVQLVYNHLHHHNTDIFKSVIGHGTAEIVNDVTEKENLLQAIVDRYHKEKVKVTSNDVSRCLIFKVLVTQIWGKEKKIPKQMSDIPHIFKAAKPEEAEEIFHLYEKRVCWMNAKGMNQWNVTDYLERYPVTYYQEQCSMGYMYTLRTPKNILLGAVVLYPNDVRWLDKPKVPAYYIHNLVTDTSVKGIGEILLANVERLAINHGKHFLRLDCACDNEFLNKYYERQGFILSGICEDGKYKGNCREKNLLNNLGIETDMLKHNTPTI